MKNSETSAKIQWISFLVILLAYLVLFFLDYETNSILQLFETGNIVAATLYILPTFMFCLLLQYFFRKLNERKQLWYSLLIAIPLGFAGVMMALMANMGRL